MADKNTIKAFAGVLACSLRQEFVDAKQQLFYDNYMKGGNFDEALDIDDRLWQLATKVIERYNELCTPTIDEKMMIEIRQRLADIFYDQYRLYYQTLRPTKGFKMTKKLKAVTELGNLADGLIEKGATA